MNYKHLHHLSVYSPELLINPTEDCIFVFGSNTQGRHGKGAAKLAVQKFGAKYGQAEGIQGRSYAIITKDLTKKVHPSVDSVFIMMAIIQLYKYARNHKDKKFLIPYEGFKENLCGYSTADLMAMFVLSCPPSNVYFKQSAIDEMYEKKKTFLIVAGSRDFEDYHVLTREVSKYLEEIVYVPNPTIISGAARGADSLGQRFASEFKTELITIAADWDKFGKKAGYLRNTEMAKIGNDCICFWDGISKGSEHMINTMKSQRKRVKVVKYLECSSAGNIKFSAFGAKIEYEGEVNTIEYIYQSSKRFNGVQLSPKEAKGKKPTSFVVNGVECNVKYLSQFYLLLWVKYLRANPDLVSYADQYDVYTDKFRGKSLNCQADAIYVYVKLGDKEAMKRCSELIKFLKQNTNGKE